MHRRDYNPEDFSAYELRNGVSDEREKERAVLAFAHYKEDVQDAAEEAQQVLHGLQFTKCAPAPPQLAAHRRACATRDLLTAPPRPLCVPAACRTRCTPSS